jgi:hypothetical protein
VKVPEITIEPLPMDGGREKCELPLCHPRDTATFKAIFPDGRAVLMCNRHASGVLAIFDYLNEAT